MLDPISLGNAELFIGLSPEEIAEISPLAKPWTAAARQVLFRLGEEAKALHLLQDGEVELTLPFKVMGEVHEVRFHTIVPPQVLAWSALVPPYRLTMSAQATVESQLVTLERTDLLQLFERHPRIGWITTSNLTKVMGTRLNVTRALWIRELQRHVA